MIDRLMRSPMPVPRGLVVKNGSNICSASCAGKPMPVSLTDTRICSFSPRRDLLQLHTISDDLRKIGCQFSPDRYVVSHCLVAQEGDGLSIDLVYINNLSIQGAPLEL